MGRHVGSHTQSVRIALHHAGSPELFDGSTNFSCHAAKSAVELIRSLDEVAFICSRTNRDRRDEPVYENRKSAGWRIGR